MRSLSDLSFDLLKLFSDVLQKVLEILFLCIQLL